MANVRRKSFAAEIKEHHVSRSGGDPRGLTKKEGAGAFNWGRAGDEGEDAPSDMSASPPPDSKLVMASPAKFEAAKKANSH
ncbi:hypothetical protein GGI21_005983 [Coemansia aciculifera]|uniref:Uncharacterized protein n=1 Tax=Coemansia aciculifera TaxID=417176 RepID=A0ACC1M9N9_9FUNG|nr:hypothetical protein GGI21_005983 [Coemansia aciculifera]KAJ2900689.1 hypothetical protein IWW38_000363 [Coemansia aciculifera]